MDYVFNPADASVALYLSSRRGFLMRQSEFIAAKNDSVIENDAVKKRLEIHGCKTEVCRKPAA